jgi:hypothetical protein
MVHFILLLDRILMSPRLELMLNFLIVLIKNINNYMLK